MQVSFFSTSSSRLGMKLVYDIVGSSECQQTPQADLDVVLFPDEGGSGYETNLDIEHTSRRHSAFLCNMYTLSI